MAEQWVAEQWVAEQWVAEAIGLDWDWDWGVLLSVLM